MNVVNFLPWREIQQKNNRQRFVLWLCVSCVISLLLNFCCYFYFYERYVYLQQSFLSVSHRHQGTDVENKKYESLLAEKETLLKRVAEIEAVRNDRRQQMDLLSDLQYLLAKHLFFASFKQRDGQVELSANLTYPNFLQLKQYLQSVSLFRNLVFQVTKVEVGLESPALAVVVKGGVDAVS